MKIDNVISFTSYPISKQEIKDLKKEDLSSDTH